MERLGYYLKPGVRPTAPGVLFSVVVSPRIDQGGATEADAWYSWGGADVYFARRNNGRWGSFASARCETPAALWRWMAARCDRYRRNYVILPDGQEGAACSQFWDELDNRKVFYTPSIAGGHKLSTKKYGAGATLVRRVVTSARAFILDYARDRCRWIVLGGRQFLESPEEALAVSVGFEPSHVQAVAGTDGKDCWTASDRAALWLTLFMRLSDWWLENSKAPFGLTGSALSFGMLRTHVKRQALCTHTDPDALPLERAACFGGRAQTYFFGDVGNPAEHARPFHPAPPASVYGSLPGPMYQLDVRSMYPWLLREQSFPRKIKEYRENMLPSEPQELAKSFGVIARVTIETDRADYPERVADRIYYRTGRFTTTLTGPELLALKADGRVKHCHACAVYHLGRPFREVAGALIAMREAARSAQNPAWELFAKLLGNGLGGKLAQKRGEWLPRPDKSAPVRFGEWIDAEGRRGARKRFRAIAGIVWEWCPDATGAGPYTAAFAYLAAYGRLHLKGLRDALPAETVVSIDTDGLWVLAGGVDCARSQGWDWSGRAGDVVVKEESPAGRFFGPRHYFTAADWTLAGFSSPSISGDCRSVNDTQRVTPIAGPVGCPPRGTAVRLRSSALAIEAHGQMIDPFGWAHPRRKG